MKNYTISKATTIQDKILVYQLRYRVYIVAENRFNKADFPEGIMKDAYDDSLYATNLIIKKNNIPIGTVRITEKNPLTGKVAADELYDFSKAKELTNGSYAGVGMLAVLREHQNIFLFKDVLKYLAGHFLKRKISHGLFPLNHACANIFLRYGAKQLGEKFYSDKVRNHIVPMALGADTLAGKLKILPGIQSKQTILA